MRTTAKTIKANCIQCGIEFKPKRGSVGKFCTMACKHDHTKSEKINGRTSYFNCCKCHAILGFGISVSSRLIGIAKGSIAQGMKNSGVKRYVPNGGSWRLYAQKQQNNVLPEFETWWCSTDSQRKEIKSLWMSEYNCKFPDWSIIATRWKNSKYQSRMHRESPKGSIYRLKKIVRCRIYNSIKRSTNAKPRLKKRTTEMLGCSIDEMKKHLEKQFKDGMTWENHGSHWHVDHIIPLSQFDFTNPIQFALATHYTNLQPMWAEENSWKSDRITQTHQLRFA